MDNMYIQDSSKRLVVGGTDIEARYTSLEAIEVANIVFNAVQESRIQFDGMECKVGPGRGCCQ